MRKDASSKWRISFGSFKELRWWWIGNSIKALVLRERFNFKTKPLHSTYSIGALALFFVMSKFMAFEAAHWKQDVLSHWYFKVTSSQACRRLWTIKSQDDSIGRNLKVCLTHMNASGVDDILEILQKLFFHTDLELVMLDDTLGSVEALVRPNSYRDV